MTAHASVCSIFALLWLCVTLLGLPAQKTAPTLAERLDRLAAEFDRNRNDLHVPGAVLAIVRGEEVISLADSASMASNLNRLVCLPCG
jgi:CubicO group peptidase (beta-lactamase class C family)